MMDLHILSDPVTDFWKCPKKWLKKIFVGIFLSDPQKLNLNILNMAWWSIGTNNVFVDTQNFLSTKKKGVLGVLKVNFLQNHILVKCQWIFLEFSLRI